jgi:ribosomal subunit interface protein
MQLPLQIVFRNIEWTESIAEKIRERAAKLDQYCDSIMSCRVAVDAPHKHHRHGNRYHVRIDVTVPGDELIASREPDEHHAYADAYVAIRDAFDTMSRLLEDYDRRRRREVKTHEVPPHGRIVELHPEKGYGRIETLDGRLIYFHRNSVVDWDFGALQPGAEVRFVEEMGERGPQASTVHPLGKRHIVG